MPAQLSATEERPKLLLHGVNSLIQIGSLGDVSCYCDRAAAQFFDLLDSAIETGTRSQVEASHGGANFRESHGNTLTNPTAGAGNKRNLSFKAK